LVFVTFAQFLKRFNALRRVLIETSTSPADTRLTALKTWTSGIDAVAGGEPVPASADASFRRYFRLQSGANSFTQALEIFERLGTLIEPDKVREELADL